MRHHTDEWERTTTSDGVLWRHPSCSVLIYREDATRHYRIVASEACEDVAYPPLRAGRLAKAKELAMLAHVDRWQ